MFFFTDRRREDASLRLTPSLRRQTSSSGLHRRRHSDIASLAVDRRRSSDRLLSFAVEANRLIPNRYAQDTFAIQSLKYWAMKDYRCPMLEPAEIEIYVRAHLDIPQSNG